MARTSCGGYNTYAMRNESRVESKEIRQMVRRIVSRFHPERIILFGSHARGDARPTATSVC